MVASKSLVLLAGCVLVVVALVGHAQAADARCQIADDQLVHQCQKAFLEHQFDSCDACCKHFECGFGIHTPSTRCVCLPEHMQAVRDMDTVYEWADQADQRQ